MSGKQNLTDRDIKLLANAWMCMTAEPSIDYDRLATIAGVKNKDAAYKALWSTKRKLKTFADDDAAVAATAGQTTKPEDVATATTPKSARKRAAAKPSSSSKKRKVVKEEQKSEGSPVDAQEPEEDEDALDYKQNLLARFRMSSNGNRNGELVDGEM